MTTALLDEVVEDWARFSRVTDTDSVARNPPRPVAGTGDHRRVRAGLLLS